MDCELEFRKIEFPTPKQYSVYLDKIEFNLDKRPLSERDFPFKKGEKPCKNKSN